MFAAIVCGIALLAISLQPTDAEDPAECTNYNYPIEPLHPSYDECQTLDYCKENINYAAKQYCKCCIAKYGNNSWYYL